MNAKNGWMAVVGAVAAVALACGQSGSQYDDGLTADERGAAVEPGGGDGQQGSSLEPAGMGPTALGGGYERFELRLRGEQASAGLTVRVKEVLAFSGGEALPLERVDGELDLSNTGHAWLLARFAAPGNAEDVSFVVSFEEVGELTRDGAATTVDLSGPPLRFTSTLAQLRARGRAVVHLEVDRSLMNHEGADILLPQLRLFH